MMLRPWHWLCCRGDEGERRGSRRSRRGAPAASRAWVLVALALGLAAAPPAYAPSQLPGWPYQVYRANLHVHTGLSKTEDQAKWWPSVNPYDYDHCAADDPVTTCSHAISAHLDCAGLSDHHTALGQTEWESLGTVTNAATKGGFVVLRGFEWTKGGGTSPEVAHVNVFGSSAVAPTGPTEPSLEDFRQWVLDQGKRDPHLVCQFNHPTYGGYRFDGFALPPAQPDLVKYFTLLEVGSGPTFVSATSTAHRPRLISAYRGLSLGEPWYRLALRQGWRVAPTIGIDNFGSLKEYGARDRHTAILVDPDSDHAPGVSQEDVLDALRQRRTYASEDPDYQLEYWAGKEPGQEQAFMGGVIPAKDGDKIQLHLRAISAPSRAAGIVDGVGKVYLVTVRSQQWADREELLSDVSRDFSYSATHEVTVAPEDICYYLRIKQRGTGKNWVISAPIWVGRQPTGATGRGAPATSTVLVMDCSTSMNSKTPDGVQKLEAAKRAARHYLEVIRFDAEELGAAHQVGVMSFSDRVYEALAPEPDITRAHGAIDRFSPIANTNFGDSLDKAISWLEHDPGTEPAGRRVVLFLSDGMTNTGPVARNEFVVDTPDAFASPLRLYQRARDGRIVINTIGFGDPSQQMSDDGCDEEVLRKLAEVPGTGGRSVHAEDALELDEVYLRSFHNATGDVVFEHSGTVAQGERQVVGSFNPAAATVAARTTVSFLFGSPAYAGAAATSQMLVTLGWSAGKLTLELRDPGGRLVDASYPGAHLKLDEQPYCIAIDSPPVGAWSATVIGDAIPTGQSRYHFIASARVPPAPISAAVGGGASGIDVATAALISVLVGVFVLGVLCLALLLRRRAGPATPTPRPAGWLQVSGPGRPSRNVPLYGALVRIGRHGSSDLVLPDQEVSDHHAEVRLHDGQAVLTDLGSRNGTWVNGERVTQRWLRHGDRLQMGGTRLVYLVSMPPVEGAVGARGTPGSA